MHVIIGACFGCFLYEHRRDHPELPAAKRHVPGRYRKRTGLLRCYLSRVENGHTIPSLDTLAKIAGAMEIALSQFFSESGHTNGSKNLPQLSDDEVRFLSQIRRYSVSLNEATASWCWPWSRKWRRSKLSAVSSQVNPLDTSMCRQVQLGAHALGFAEG